MNNQAVFSWEAKQFDPKVRSTDWYWIVGIITVIAVGLSVWAKDYLFGVVLLIGGIIIMVLQGKNPHTVVVDITNKGIRVNNNMHRFESLESFWMFPDETGRTRILLHIARPFVPYFSIPIPEEIKASDVRSFLVSRVKEQEHKEPTTELLMRTFGL